MRRHGPNWPIALASLTLSIMLWFVVYAQNVPAPQNVRAPLTVDGLNDRSFFVRKIPNDVRLVVNAPADRAKDLAQERVTAAVDLSEPREGLHDYPLMVSPDWVRRYLQDSTPTVRVEIERVATRSLPITSVVKGALSDRNIQVVRRVLSPRQATLYGPASEVDAVREVRAYLDLSAISAVNQEPQESDLVPLDDRGGRPQDVQTTPRIALYTFKLDAAERTQPTAVRVNVDDVTYDPSVVGNGIRVDPPSVDIKGKPDALSRVDQIQAAPIHAHGITRDRTFRVKLIPPRGTTLVGPKEVSVTILVLPAPKPAPAKEKAVLPPTSETRPAAAPPSDVPPRR